MQGIQGFRQSLTASEQILGIPHTSGKREGAPKLPNSDRLPLSYEVIPRGKNENTSEWFASGKGLPMKGMPGMGKGYPKGPVPLGAPKGFLEKKTQRTKGVTPLGSSERSWSPLCPSQGSHDLH